MASKTRPATNAVTRKPIPERAPIGDLFRGVVLRIGQAQALALAAQAGAEVIASGEFTVRYGVAYLGKAQLSIVPGLLVLDYGDILTGEEAWDFLLKRSNLHPRAEVVGYRSDGKDDIVALKFLDLALPVRVLVYDSAEATSPIAQPKAFIASDTSSIAPRLIHYLSVYNTVAEWQMQIT